MSKDRAGCRGAREPGSFAVVKDLLVWVIVLQCFLVVVLSSVADLDCFFFPFGVHVLPGLRLVLLRV